MEFNSTIVAVVEPEQVFDVADILTPVRFGSVVLLSVGMLVNVVVLMMSAKMDSDAGAVVYIQALAVYEFLFCTEFALFTFEQMGYYSVMTINVWFCRGRVWWNWSLVATYPYFYLALIVERAVAVSWPIFYKHKCKKGPARWISLGIAMFGIIAAFPIPYYRKLEAGSCFLPPESLFAVNIIQYGVMMFIPVSVIVCATTVIVVQLQCKKKKPGQSKDAGMKQENRLTLVVVLMALFTGLSIGLGKIGTWYFHYSGYSPLGQLGLIGTTGMTAINSIINLGLYAMAPSMREALKSVFGIKKSP